MHPRVDEFVARVEDRHGFDAAVTEFSETTRTAGDAAAAIGCSVAQIASSLVFLVDGDPVVAVTSGANRVDESALAGVAGAETVEMADPETVQETTGWAIGGVPPICHDRPVPVYVDETLTDHAEVWAGAGVPEAVFPIAPDDLIAFADATPAAFVE
ncbi:MULTISPECIES: YbaK/EbsC family protein [Haloarcula]|uniref:YbaK/EbsC family protein n=1 Tax=Haloarcula TaxID=2237 RepID=UPI0023ECCDCE|nr:YbaK/EbsC family protein [Halomicroarcula sp. XH51]